MGKNWPGMIWALGLLAGHRARHLASIDVESLGGDDGGPFSVAYNVFKVPITVDRARGITVLGAVTQGKHGAVVVVT